jgi:hypothetical protein
MPPEKKEDEKEEKLVMVGDGVEEGDQPEKDADEEAKKAKAKTDKEADDDADEDEEDEEPAAKKGDKRVAHAEGEEEDEDAEQTTRRQERQRRKQRQREARERNEKELRYLRLRNEQLERNQGRLEGRVRNTEASVISGRIATLKSQIEAAKDIEAKAIKAGEGEDVVEAREIREELEKGLERLEAAKTQLEKEAKDSKASDNGADPPEHIKLALGWIKKNPWFKPNGKDEDSVIARALETTLLEEGYNPASPEYWEAFDKKVRKRLPHLYKGKKSEEEDSDDDDEDDAEDEIEERPERRSKINGKDPDEKPTRKAGGPRVSVGGRERTLKPGEVYVSPERKAAMIEAGVWDDPKLRERQLKAYRRWDEENRT